MVSVYICIQVIALRQSTYRKSLERDSIGGMGMSLSVKRFDGKDRVCGATSN